MIPKRKPKGIKPYWVRLFVRGNSPILRLRAEVRTSSRACLSVCTDIVGDAEVLRNLNHRGEPMSFDPAVYNPSISERAQEAYKILLNILSEWIKSEPITFFTSKDIQQEFTYQVKAAANRRNLAYKYGVKL